MLFILYFLKNLIRTIHNFIKLNLLTLITTTQYFYYDNNIINIS